MKIRNAIFRGVIIVSIGLLIGIQVYMLNARKLTGNTLPMPFGYGAAVVLSGSMEPTLLVDDLIFVREEDTYEVDDIIVFQERDMLVVHRLIAKTDNGVITQGDANNAPDAPVPEESIKGKVIGRISGIGALIRLIRMPAVTLSLVILAVFLMERSYQAERRTNDVQLEVIRQEIRRLREEAEDR